MRDMTLEEFCQKHAICDEGSQWALSECTSCLDAWDKLNPEWLLYVATRHGVLSENDVRKIAWWCALQVVDLTQDQRSEDAVATVQLYVDGYATLEDVSEAHVLAAEAAREDLESWARKAAYACTLPETVTAAMETSVYAARAVPDSEQYFQDQAAWIRENLTPSFTYIE